MATEVVPRIYEPFFTTARNQGGTGLGLHILHNLITQHLRGQIQVQSELAQGTSFTIQFPIPPEPVTLEPIP
jgi:signal transduction histidine kinase